MTICFKNSAEAAKFFSRCLFEKTCERDRVNWNFSEVKMSTLFPQIEVKGKMSVQEVEDLLNYNKVKFEWVSEY